MCLLKSPSYISNDTKIEFIVSTPMTWEFHNPARRRLGSRWDSQVMEEKKLNKIDISIFILSWYHKIKYKYANAVDDDNQTALVTCALLAIVS